MQLFDLQNDIGEKLNVQAKNADVVERLTKLLRKQTDNGRSRP